MPTRVPLQTFQILEFGKHGGTLSPDLGQFATPVEEVEDVEELLDVVWAVALPSLSILMRIGPCLTTASATIEVPCASAKTTLIIESSAIGNGSARRKSNRAVEKRGIKSEQ